MAVPGKFEAHQFPPNFGWRACLAVRMVLALRESEGSIAATGRRRQHDAFIRGNDVSAQWGLINLFINRIGLKS
jgi:hypothetical protein